VETKAAMRLKTNALTALLMLTVTMTYFAMAWRCAVLTVCALPEFQLIVETKPVMKIMTSALIAWLIVTAAMAYSAMVKNNV